MACSIHTVFENEQWNYCDLKTFLERDATSINDLDDEQGVTPLHRALMTDKCSLNIVKLLLQYGADVNLVSRISSALFIALMHHKGKDIIQILLEAGADMNTIDAYYIMPPLCMALRSGASADVIELLLKSGCPIDNSGEYSSMLHCATDYELKADVCKLLLQAGAGDVNKLDKYGESVLCYALNKGTELEAIKMLMDAGASLTACMEHESAWLCATSFTSMLRGDILKVLLDAGIKISPVNQLDETPLQCALRYCVYDTSAIELLINLQVGEVANSPMDKMLLVDATFNYACTLSVVKLLIDRKVQVDVTDDFKDTPLHLLLRYNSCSPDIIKYLLEKGVPVNAKNYSGDTALRMAVEKAHKMSIIELLLKGGAYINMPDDCKIPMLKLIWTHYQVNPSQEEEHYDIFKLFLKYTFLENISFEIESIVSEISLNYDVFFGFARECVCELQDMKLKKIGCMWVLHELIDRNSESKIKIDNPNPQFYEQHGPSVALAATNSTPMYDFDLLLEALGNNKYPVYFDVISSNIGREAMVSQLTRVNMCVMKSSPGLPCVQTKVMLNSDCVRRIAGFLWERDLLNFLIAFSIPKLASQHQKPRKRRCAVPDGSSRICILNSKG